MWKINGTSNFLAIPQVNVSLSRSIFRMDLPPPFKPPPPPVKYTAARQSDFSTQRFPTSRCNSVAFENRIITPDTLHIDRWYITRSNHEECDRCSAVRRIVKSVMFSCGQSRNSSDKTVAGNCANVGCMYIWCGFFVIVYKMRVWFLYFHQTHSDPLNVDVWF